MMDTATLDLGDVRAFLLTAQLSGFTRAADALGTSQAAISMKVRRLESQLGRRLLERTPRYVRLSADGSAFLEAARDLVGAHDRALGAFDAERRRVVVGISQYLLGVQLPPLLQQLHNFDSKLHVELRAAGSGALLRQLEEGVLDAAILLQDAKMPRAGRTLCAERFGWMGAPQWRPRAGEPLPLSTQGEACSIRRMATRALDAVGIAWTEAFVGQGAACVGAAASAGLALALLAERVAPPGTVDLGPKLGLPSLPLRKVVLICATRERHSRDALEIVSSAFADARR
ncbi:MAG TPA: LysR family transcriptional regulator [Rudaea sp.]|nr:LysR family transcriptional regulator [Rudaea sp.]